MTVRCVIAALLLAAAARAADWQATLTPLQPGPFPPLRPLHATYRFGWSAMHAATADFDFSQTKDGPLKLEVKARSEGVVRKLWKMDAAHTALCDAATLLPISMRQKETYRDETLTTSLDFDAGGVSRLRESDPPGKSPPKTKRFKYAGLFDLHSALLFVRSQPLSNGDVVRIVVYPAVDPYLAEIEVLGRERIEVAKKKYDAVKLGLKLREITKKLELKPHAKFKKGTAWLSDDRDRLLLKIQAEVFVGKVWTELESVKFSEQ
jgi:hypothetical protein